MMTRFPVSLCVCLAVGAALVAAANTRIRTGDQLVSSVVLECSDLACVKSRVLSYLDSLLNIYTEDARDIKNIDATIFKRVARVVKSHEFHFQLPEMIFGNTEIVYSPRTGLDVASPESDSESRGVLKKKLLLPVLLLLKLKMKALMPIFVALIGIKAVKALILSKLAIGIVLGFVIFQLFKKGGMPMPMSMMPMMPAMEPATGYGAPAPSSTPSSYEPGWEPNMGGPYSRIWSSSSSSSSNAGAGDSAQGLAYSAYYPGPSSAAPATSS